jgi:hypothetical protein
MLVLSVFGRQLIRTTANLTEPEHHARQHLWDLAALLYPYDAAAKKRWMVSMKDLLDHGRTEILVEWLREIAAAHAGTQPGLTEEIGKQADYFETNTRRMQYPAYREQGFFVGSGVIEAGCKSIVGVRLKQSGMFWTVRGPTPSLLCAAAGSISGSKTSGRRHVLPEPFGSHFYVAHPF